jgi:hypothetical protein
MYKTEISQNFEMQAHLYKYSVIKSHALNAVRFLLKKSKKKIKLK